LRKIRRGSLNDAIPADLLKNIVFGIDGLKITDQMADVILQLPVQMVAIRRSGTKLNEMRNRLDDAANLPET
jgi:hypothetical protein